LPLWAVSTERVNMSRARRYHTSNKGAMVTEDWSKVAGLPQEVSMKDMPKCPTGGGDFIYGDNLEYADKQMRQDIGFFTNKDKSTNM
jgi:hypothetical protein